MSRFNNSETGFSAVETLLILLIIAVISFVGWFVWHTKQVADENLTNTTSSAPKFKRSTSPISKATTNSSAKSTSFRTKDGLVEVSYPSDWTNDGFTAASCGSVPCIGFTTFQPTSQKTANGPRVTVYEVKTSQSSKDWFTSVIRDGSTSSNSTSINGYDTYYNDYATNVSDDMSYVLSHKGYSVYLVFNNKDFPQYQPNFIAIAKSVKFALSLDLALNWW